jgi:hypothetical protein
VHRHYLKNQKCSREEAERVKIDSGYNLSLFDNFAVKDRRALKLEQILAKSFEGALNYPAFCKEWIEAVNLEVDLRLLTGAVTELLLYGTMMAEGKLLGHGTVVLLYNG